jgi:hypothetical protein
VLYELRLHFVEMTGGGAKKDDEPRIIIP